MSKDIQITLSVNTYEMAERLEWFLNAKVLDFDPNRMSSDDPKYISMANNYEDTKEYMDYCIREDM